MGGAEVVQHQAGAAGEEGTAVVHVDGEVHVDHGDGDDGNKMVVCSSTAGFGFFIGRARRGCRVTEAG